MKNKFDESPFSIACKFGLINIIKYLVRNGADLNIKDNDGNTPIIISYNNDLKNNDINFSLTKILYKYGANISIRNNNNESILTILEKNENSLLKNNIKKILNLQRKDGETSLTFSCKIGNIEVIKKLINLGIDVNTENRYGNTPLNIICSNNNINDDEKLELIENLIEKGANINSEDRYGYTPLTIAIHLNNKKLINFLINKNVNVTEKSLTIAKTFKTEKILELLSTQKNDESKITLNDINDLKKNENYIKKENNNNNNLKK